MFKYIIFDLTSSEPVAVAVDIAEAKSRLKIITNTKGGMYAVKPFKKYSEMLQKTDLEKYNRLMELVADKTAL